ncbi:hypothetical protein ACWA1C_20255 [Flectobacillus roseus]
MNKFYSINELLTAVVGVISPTSPASKSLYGFDIWSFTSELYKGFPTIADLGFLISEINSFHNPSYSTNNYLTPFIASLFLAQ